MYEKTVKFSTSLGVIYAITCRYLMEFPFFNSALTPNGDQSVSVLWAPCFILAYTH